jgi:predicted Zn finger-like uncharacterized protein
MNLVTRCPSCGTAFRVQREQLAAHFGTVRCGKCGEVFNGVAALVEEGADQLSLDPSPQLGLFDPSRRPAHASADEPAPLPEFLAGERSTARPRAWLWALASIAAAVALGAQIFELRGELTNWLPESRPLFAAACKLADCEVPLPRRPELLRIVSSDMHDDPGRQVFVLNALLRNLGRFPQQYPDLELTLTDQGKPVARRVLRPEEYLEPRRIKNGLEAGAEEPLRVHVNAKIVRATGYELCIYPHDCLKEPAKQ